MIKGRFWDLNEKAEHQWIRQSASCIGNQSLHTHTGKNNPHKNTDAEDRNN